MCPLSTWGAEAEAIEVSPFRLTRRYLTPASTPTGSTCRRLLVPDAPEIRAALNELITRLTSPAVWDQRAGGVTPDETAVLCTFMWESESVCMLGAIFPYAAATPPPGCLPCNGSLFLRVDYPQLWAVLDPAFKVDADTFRTPDLQGRSVIGAGAGGGLTARTVGEAGGAESVTLEVSQIPAHAHTSPAHTHIADPHTHTTQPHAHAYDPVLVGDLDTEAVGVPQPNAAQIVPLITENTYDATVIVNAADVDLSATAVTLEETGGDQGHNNMPPYTALKYCMVAR